MTALPFLLTQPEEIDFDGAIQETGSKVDGHTRGSFMRKAGIGAGALVRSGAFFGALPSIASSGIAVSDVAILNYALTLEYLEAAFYAETVATRGRLPQLAGAQCAGSARRPGRPSAR